MPKKRIVILGAGISGLTLAYDLSHADPSYDITLIEKKDRPGGWIESREIGGFFFENGPRTFRAARSEEIYRLVHDVGLSDELIFSDPKGRGRWLWIDGRLQKVPIWNFALLRALLREWRIPPNLSGDETVWEFAVRRLNEPTAMRLFDPLVIGIYGGDIRNVSIKACFPLWKEWEERYGSLTRGMWNERPKKGPFLFTLRHGVESLVHRLVQEIRGCFLYEHQVHKIAFTSDTATIHAGGKTFTADHVVSALPVQEIAHLLNETPPVTSTGTTVVNIGYSTDVLQRKGFGYIVSSQEQKQNGVLGVVFNSNSFPQQSRRSQETRLTVKLRRTDLSDAEALTLSREALKIHLGITADPDIVHIVRAQEAFPQMTLDYLERIEKWRDDLTRKHPRLTLIGNYLAGVGVNDCIKGARRAATSFSSA
jgi:oxygen-dependent protoporphyrinogen oxidase